MAKIHASAMRMRVFVDGHDISQYVHHLEIEARAGELMKTRLELYTGVTMGSDGAVHIGGPPRFVTEEDTRAIKIED